ncbi:VPS4-associated protein 1 [[Candida] anglica]|uniref:VPS4-associated protein 1 n=1 Tax=[Candida] anglica TaxID=148631 RepID=A0ABP0EFG4_9ASCO
MSAPFLNKYTLREVAASDSKSCYVCYKPTVKVLISDNKVDFFYICSSHLKDTSFANAIHPEEYENIVKEKAKLIIKVTDLESEISKLGYNWDFINKIPGLGSKDKDKVEVKESDKKDAKTLQLELSKARTEVEEFTAKLKDFPFKEYNLDQNIYRNRLRGHIQVKANQKRQQELSKPGFFPSAPSSQLS